MPTKSPENISNLYDKITKGREIEKISADEMRKQIELEAKKTKEIKAQTPEGKELVFNLEKIRQD